ncbi:MAG: transposase [Gammaproteobacteria bacterium]
MKKKLFTLTQIIPILKELERILPVIELNRKHEVSEAIIYIWRNKFSGILESELKRLSTHASRSSIFSTFNGMT